MLEIQEDVGCDYQGESASATVTQSLLSLSRSFSLSLSPPSLSAVTTEDRPPRTRQALRPRERTERSAPAGICATMQPVAGESRAPLT